MLILAYVLTLHIRNIIAIEPVNQRWVDILIGQLTQTRNYYQIMIFKNASDGAAEENYIFQKLGARLPILLVDTSKVTNGTQLLAPGRTTTLYVIFQISSSSNELANLEQSKANLDSILRLPLPKQHPRCVMMSFRNSANSSRFFRDFLLYAWSKKLLDLAIVNVSSTGVAQAVHYDPFAKLYSSELYAPGLNLFPDKLADMHQFEVKLPYLSGTPYIIRTGKDTYDGIEYKIISFITRLLNLKVIIVDYESNELTEVVRDLKLGKLAFLSFSLPIIHPSFQNNEGVERGSVFTYDSFCAAVSPTFYIDPAMLYAPLKTMMLIVIGVGSVLFIIVAVERMGITQQRWSLFVIVQLILGSSGVKQPRKSRDRFVFISIVFLSMISLENIYSTFTEYELSNKPIPLATFRDVLDSKLAPYMTKGGYRWIFGMHDEYFEEIKPHIKVDTVQNCIRKILKSKNVICFTMKSKARMYERMNQYPDGSSMIRIGEIKFMKSGKSLFFEPGSPFVEKFNFIVRKMAESGIVENLFHGQRKRGKRLEDHKIERNNYVLLPLSTILIIGEAASILIFFIELTCRFCK